MAIVLTCNGKPLVVFSGNSAEHRVKTFIEQNPDKTIVQHSGIFIYADEKGPPPNGFRGGPWFSQKPKTFVASERPKKPTPYQRKFQVDDGMDQESSAGILRPQEGPEDN